MKRDQVDLLIEKKERVVGGSTLTGVSELKTFLVGNFVNLKKKIFSFFFFKIFGTIWKIHNIT